MNEHEKLFAHYRDEVAKHIKDGVTPMILTIVLADIIGQITATYTHVSGRENNLKQIIKVFIESYDMVKRGGVIDPANVTVQS